jgi:hypothetical protein
MEKVRDALKAAVLELISQEQEQERDFSYGHANDVRIEHGVPENVILLGSLCADHRKFMVSSQMKELFLSIGIHLCMYEDSRSRNGDYSPPPPRIRTSAPNASGSCLR